MATEDDAAAPGGPRLEWWKIGLVAIAALICLGAILRLATDGADTPRAGGAESARKVKLSSTLPGVASGSFFATDGDLTVDNSAFWVLQRSGRRMTARAMGLAKGGAQAARAMTFRLADRHTKLLYDVTRWGEGSGEPALVTVSFDGTVMRTTVQEITSAGRVLATGELRIARPLPGMTREVAVVRYDGRRPDVVVLDRGLRAERPTVAIVDGERQFTAVKKRLRLQFRGFSAQRWRVDFVRFNGPLPEMFAYQLGRSPRQNVGFNMAHGETDFSRFVYSPKLALGSKSDLVIRTGTLHGAVSAYVMDPGRRPFTVRVVQLVDETPVL